jgi:hypothetical protein
MRWEDNVIKVVYEDEKWTELARITTKDNISVVFCCLNIYSISTLLQFWQDYIAG